VEAAGAVVLAPEALVEVDHVVALVVAVEAETTATTIKHLKLRIYI
jgi:hypothetical protein